MHSLYAPLVVVISSHVAFKTHVDKQAVRPVHPEASGSEQDVKHSSQSFFAADVHALPAPPLQAASASSSISQPSQANVSLLRHSASSSTHPSQSEYCDEHPSSSALATVALTSLTQSSCSLCEQPSHEHLMLQISSAETLHPPAEKLAMSPKTDQARIHVMRRGLRTMAFRTAMCGMSSPLMVPRTRISSSYNR